MANVHGAENAVSYDLPTATFQSITHDLSGAKGARSASPDVIVSAPHVNVARRLVWSAAILIANGQAFPQAIAGTGEKDQ